MKKIIACALFAAAGLAQAQLEKPDVHIAVGGKASFYYLPLTIAEQLGYFKDEGLNVRMSDFQGGAQSLRAVVGGSADVVSGAYEHTITLQSKKQNFQAFVLQGRLPQMAFGVATAKAGGIKSFKDLKGLKVGVSAPGSSTHNLVKQLLTLGGLDPNKDVSVVGGSADVVSGAYEHTITLQSKKQNFQAFVLQGRLPQMAFGVGSAKATRAFSPGGAAAVTLNV